MIYHAATKKIKGEKEYFNITQMVIDEVKKSGVWMGKVIVFPLHTTVGIKRQEDEPGLMQDIKRAFFRLFPKDTYYEHDDFEKRTVNKAPNERKNAAAHLMATFFTNSFELITIKNGELALGRWQSILFFDFDPKGRGSREIEIWIEGEPYPDDNGNGQKNNNHKKS